MRLLGFITRGCKRSRCPLALGMVVSSRMGVKVPSSRANLAGFCCSSGVIIPGALRKALLARGLYTSDTRDSVPVGIGAALRLSGE